MTESKTIVLTAMKDAGKRAATTLRDAAKDMTGTEIIDQEQNVPDWDGSKDYTNSPVGTPVADENQVWSLIQPHNAANYPGTRPSGLRALWGLLHTKNPEKAKPWVDPYGTSGMYSKGECYLAEDGTVYICLQDNCVYDATAMPNYWEKYGEETTEPEEPDTGDGEGDNEGTTDDEWPEFVKPTGAHDAYNTGDKVTYNGKHYICAMDSCVYSPDEYPSGWTLQEE